MCCEQEGRHVLLDTSASDCCCCGPGSGHPRRRYVSTNERIERLETYREQLKKELEGVDEAIGELRSG